MKLFPLRFLLVFCFFFSSFSIPGDEKKIKDNLTCKFFFIIEIFESSNFSLTIDTVLAVKSKFKNHAKALKEKSVLLGEFLENLSKACSNELFFFHGHFQYNLFRFFNLYALKFYYKSYLQSPFLLEAMIPENNQELFFMLENAKKEINWTKNDSILLIENIKDCRKMTASAIKWFAYTKGRDVLYRKEIKEIEKYVALEIKKEIEDEKACQLFLISQYLLFYLFLYRFNGNEYMNCHKTFLKLIQEYHKTKEIKVEFIKYTCDKECEMTEKLIEKEKEEYKIQEKIYKERSKFYRKSRKQKEMKTIKTGEKRKIESRTEVVKKKRCKEIRVELEETSECHLPFLESEETPITEDEILEQKKSFEEDLPEKKTPKESRSLEDNYKLSFDYLPYPVIEFSHQLYQSEKKLFEEVNLEQEEEANVSPPTSFMENAFLFEEESTSPASTKINISRSIMWPPLQEEEKEEIPKSPLFASNIDETDFLLMATRLTEEEKKKEFN